MCPGGDGEKGRRSIGEERAILVFDKRQSPGAGAQRDADFALLGEIVRIEDICAIWSASRDAARASGIIRGTRRNSAGFEHTFRVKIQHLRLPRSF